MNGLRRKTPGMTPRQNAAALANYDRASGLGEQRSLEAYDRAVSAAYSGVPTAPTKPGPRRRSTLYRS